MILSPILKPVRRAKNYLRDRYNGSLAKQKREFINLKLPRCINISFLEKACMFSCKMCPFCGPEVKKMYADSGPGMSFETLRRIVDSVPNDPYYTFDISNIGETLAFEPLAEFISYMKNTKPLIETVISTNALLLDGKKMRELVKSGLDHMQLSLFAENAADHEFITGTKTFDAIMGNILDAAEIRRKMGSAKPYMKIFMMGYKENKASSERFISFWSQHVDHAYVRHFYNIGCKIENMTPLYCEKSQRERLPCAQPWYSTAIRSNGDVLGCYVFHWHRMSSACVVGNINDASLTDIWNKGGMKRLREAHLKSDLRDYRVCEKCNVWDTYPPGLFTKNKNGFHHDLFCIKDFFVKKSEYRGG